MTLICSRSARKMTSRICKVRWIGLWMFSSLSLAAKQIKHVVESIHNMRSKSDSILYYPCLWVTKWMTEPYSCIVALLPRTTHEKNNLIGYRYAEYKIVDSFLWGVSYQLILPAGRHLCKYDQPRTRGVIWQPILAARLASRNAMVPQSFHSSSTSRATPWEANIAMGAVADASNITCIAGRPDFRWKDSPCEKRTMEQWMTSGSVNSFFHCLIQHSLASARLPSRLRFISGCHSTMNQP